jgi:hypothetical protein
MGLHAHEPEETNQPHRREPARLGRTVPSQRRDADLILRLQRTLGNRAVQRLLEPDGVTRTPTLSRQPPGRDRGKRPASTPARRRSLQRAMKFEIQTTNRIWRNDGKNPPTLLDRKYGPRDFLFEGTSGVRLESETHGVLEFETEWSRKRSSLEEQIKEAVEMTTAMNGAPDVGGGRKAYPFDVDHLRKGSRRELKKGAWERRKGFEGSNEKILKPGERLEVEIRDPTWKAGIQSSESFLLSQYESFLKQHEWPGFRDPVTTAAQAVLDAANTKKLPAADLVNLRNFLAIIINYIKRGQGGKASADAGAFADVEHLPAKQAFTLMSRTNFSAIYGRLLSKKEQALFKKIIQSGALLKELGLDRKDRVFVKGYGKVKHRSGPTVYQWLKSIYQGKDMLAGLSAAMGRYDVETRKGKKDTGLVKFETRNTRLGAWKNASEWWTYASGLFDAARTLRPRPSGRSETGLK